MSTTALRKRFLPLGSWAPDSPEFAPGFLDQIVNVIPVYGVYRSLQSIVKVSACPGPDNMRRTTGTYVHRISADQALDLLQPAWTELPFKDGFQPSPIKIDQPPRTTLYWEVIDGPTPDASDFILLIPRGISRTLYGVLWQPARPWNNVDPILGHFQFTIFGGFSGNYDFKIEFGLVSGDPFNPASFVPVVGGEFHEIGNLAALPAGVAGKLRTETISILNASVPNPGGSDGPNLYGFRITHDIDITTGTNEVVLPPITAVSASLTGDPKNIAGYKNEAGSSLDTAIVASILMADDAKFAITDPPISSSASSGGKGFFLRMEFPDFKNFTGHKIRLRYSTGSLAQFIGIGFYQGINRSPGDSGRLIKQWGTPTAGIGVSDDYPHIEEITLTFDDLEGIDPTKTEEFFLSQVSNWDDVWILFFAWPPTQAGTTTTLFFRPTAASFYREAPLPWERFPVIGPSPQELLGDQDPGYPPTPATGVRQYHSGPGVAPLPQTFEVSIGSHLGPFESVVAIRLCARMTNDATAAGGEQCFVRMTLIADAISPGQRKGAGSGTFEVVEDFVHPISTYTFTLNKTAFETLKNMVIEVTLLQTGDFYCTEVWAEIDTGVSSAARLHGIEYIGPKEAAPINVSWVAIEGPAATADIQQDDLKAYIGTVEEDTSATQVGKIYEVGSKDKFDEWTDVSKVGGYFSNKRDKSWSFCNFGEMVIGTNYANPVQVKMTTGNFRDLIGFDTGGIAIPNYVLDGGIYPRARFAATINAFLCLANCDPLSVPGTAQPYSFWCSRYASPQYFHIGFSTWQSSVFQLVATPGEITGMVGGEYGLIFKENSIWRADYVALPQIFNFTQVSGEQGTVQPRSIVKVDNDVYFWGIGGIYVIREGRELQEIAAQGSVRKFLFDTQFEKFAISVAQPDFESKLSARVIGGYDAYTGCVFWSYQSRMAAEEWFKCDTVLVYSPRENRFTLLRGDMAAPSFPTDRIVTVSDLFSTNQLKVGGYLSLGNRQRAGETYLLKTIMAIHDIPPEIVVFSGNDPSDPLLPPVYEHLYRSNTIASTFFGAQLGVEIEIHKVRPVFAIETDEKVPRFAIWIEANQSPAVGDTSGEVRYLDTGHDVIRERANPSAEGWIDLGKPLSGEFFKFALAFEDKSEPVVKEAHGWQVQYRIAGDR